MIQRPANLINNYKEFNGNTKCFSMDYYRVALLVHSMTMKLQLH